MKRHDHKSSKRLSVARARSEIARRNVVTLEARIAQLKAEGARQKAAVV